MRKRLLSLILALTLALTGQTAVVSASEKPVNVTKGNSFIGSVVEGAEAPAMYGSNTSISAAASVNVNSSYKDRLESKSDVNWYRFTLSSPGYISMDFQHDYIESSWTHWVVTLYGAEQKELAKYSTTGNVTSYQWGKIGLPAGTYYVKVGYSTYSDSYYNFKINASFTNSWEAEFNETYQTANTIGVNSLVNGTMRSSSDVDWFKFTLPDSGYISLNFNHQYVESNLTYWRAFLYGPEVGELVNYSFDGKTTTQTMGNIGLPQGTYYLKVITSFHSPLDYDFKINYVNSNKWETEFNDNYTTADNITTNSTVYGTIRKSGDDDWFKFNLSSSGNVTFKFNHEYVNSSLTYWRAHIYNSSMVELKTFSIDGKETSFSESLGSLSSGTYFVKIEESFHSPLNYWFSVGGAVHTHRYEEKITKATVSKNGKVEKRCSCGAISESKVIYSPKYVTFSTKEYTYDGSVKKPSIKLKDSKKNIISSSHYKISYSSGRKNVGTYYVRVTFDSAYYSGSARAAFYINPKGTAIKKLKGTTGGFTVYYNKLSSQTTGVQVQCSTSSKFTNVLYGRNKSNTATSGTLKGLKRNTKYYVRICTYKVIDGIYYYSPWSSAKYVITK